MKQNRDSTAVILSNFQLNGKIRNLEKWRELYLNKMNILAFNNLLFFLFTFLQLIMETPLEGRQDNTVDESSTFFSQIIVPPSLLDKLETVMKKK